MKPVGTPKAVVSSSPGRPENLPTPGLARLLRGKSGSRSRARSSPMVFVARSKSVGRSSALMEPTIAEEGEPSSPKVTCIGQVRIRKKNKKKKMMMMMMKKKKSSAKPKPKLASRWQWPLHRLCNLFSCRTEKASCRFFWRFWRRKKTKDSPSEDEPPPLPPIAFVREMKLDLHGENETTESDDDEGETKVFVPSATTATPPKNALLLMRCRSAPHNRSSALATCGFQVSPVPATESDEEEREESGGGMEESSREREEESYPSASQPAGLMRCKSEPAKKGEKLMEVSYSNWSRSGSGSEKGQIGMVQEEGPSTFPPP